MMTRKHLFLVGVSIFLFTQANAQIRYMDDVFIRTQIQVDTDVVYGNNYYFLNYPPAPAGTDSSNPQVAPLQMDVYSPPASDTVQSKSLVILNHSGNFLPRYMNGLPVGRKDDSTMVELAHRFAMKGYVVAVINHRLGWDPSASTQVERTRQYFNAIYRANHDAKTAVRFFTKDAATTNNYKIDPARVFMLGEGTGGYISLTYPFLNEQAETALPKFQDGSGNSVIDTNTVGFVNGIGGSMNIYNHGGYPDQVCMVGSWGGAIGDISWMNNFYPTVPVASLHCSKDLKTDIDSGNVTVPSTGEVVLFVHGSKTVVKKAVEQGLNDIWVNHTFTDPFSSRAYMLNPAATAEGLFQFEIPDIPASTNQESAPWEWWDSTAATNQAILEGSVNANVVHQNGLASNPNMSAAKGKAYCDTIIGYLVPRMYLVLTNPELSVENNHPNVGYNVYPNPYLENVTINVEQGNVIRTISVIDLNGKMLIQINDVNNSQYILQRNGINSGIYLINVETDKGSFTHKILVE